MSFLIILALAWLAIVTIIYNKFQTRARLPPGPTPWPIFGNLFQLGKLPHISLDKFSRKYGEIMMVKFGVKDVVVASSSKMAKEFLKTQDISFASRPLLAAGKYMSYNYMDMSFGPYGPTFKLCRKICLNELFTTERLDSFEHIRVDERLNFLYGLFSQNSKPIVLKEHLRRLTLSTVSIIKLGDKYFSDFKENPLNMSLSEIDGLISEWFVLNGVFNIGDWVPLLQRFDLQGYVKRMKKFSKKMDKFLNYVINDHKDRLEGEKNLVPKDMVDTLVVQCYFHAIKGNEENMSIESAKGLVMATSGTDTTATTLEWAIHELLRHPNILKKLRAELDQVIGDGRWAQENDCNNMSYLEAIIKETFRLHPVAPFLAPHLAIQDSDVSGRDPPIWEDPNEFRPERFLQGEQVSMTGQDFRLLPFGSGRRICPGYNLGLKIVLTTPANIIHGFYLILPEGSNVEDICMVECFGLTMGPEIPLSIIFRPRLPNCLYSRA